MTYSIKKLSPLQASTQNINIAQSFKHPSIGNSAMVTKNYMSGLFGRSPITPLQEHMQRVYKGIKHLIPLVEGMIESDQEKFFLRNKRYRKANMTLIK